MAKEDLTKLLQESTLTPEQVCPVVYTMSLIGQKWRSPILRSFHDWGAKQMEYAATVSKTESKR